MDHSIDLYDNGKKQHRKIRVIITIIELAAVIGAAYLIVNVCLMKTVVNGSSMSPTLTDGMQVIVDRVIYRAKSPKRFDVVLFQKSGSGELSYSSIKRIIGLPGETVKISDGIVYINDVPLEEKNAVEQMQNSGLAADGITLGEDEYFLLGDNRNNSEDSRFASVGVVKKSELKGKVRFIVSPGFDLVDKRNEAGSSTASNNS